VVRLYPDIGRNLWAEDNSSPPLGLLQPADGLRTPGGGVACHGIPAVVRRSLYLGAPAARSVGALPMWSGGPTGPETEGEDSID
jgi:hypothetical protein